MHVSINGKTVTLGIEDPKCDRCQMYREMNCRVGNTLFLKDINGKTHTVQAKVAGCGGYSERDDLIIITGPHQDGQHIYKKDLAKIMFNTSETVHTHSCMVNFYLERFQF